MTGSELSHSGGDGNGPELSRIVRVLVEEEKVSICEGRLLSLEGEGPGRQDLIGGVCRH